MREITIVPAYSASGDVVTIVITASTPEPITYEEIAMTLAAYAESLEEKVNAGDLDS